ncbi:TspO/MBR family protein [Streptomyces sp. NPDC055107]
MGVGQAARLGQQDWADHDRDAVGRSCGTQYAWHRVRHLGVLSSWRTGYPPPEIHASDLRATYDAPARNPKYGPAFVDICLLPAALGATVLLAVRVDRRASWLLAPYLLWVGYAAALNLALRLTN